VTIPIADAGQQRNEFGEVEFGQTLRPRDGSARPDTEFTEKVALAGFQSTIPLQGLHRVAALVPEA
jgi:hypothetical protein